MSRICSVIRVFTLKTGSARGLRGTKRSGTLFNLYNNSTMCVLCVFKSSVAPSCRKMFQGKMFAQIIFAFELRLLEPNLRGVVDFARSDVVWPQNN